MSDLTVDGTLTAEEGLVVSSGGATITEGLTLSGTTEMTHNGNTVLDTSSKIPTGRLYADTTIPTTAYDTYVPTSHAVREAINGLASNGESSYGKYIPMLYRAYFWLMSSSYTLSGQLVFRVNGEYYKFRWGSAEASTSPGGSITFSSTYGHAFSYPPFVVASASQGSYLGTAGFRYISPYAITTTGFSYTCSDDESYNSGYMRYMAFGRCASS